jgi:transcriptional regulator with XRE-family HTH domain
MAREIGARGPWRDLILAYGTLKEFAALVGVTPSTITKWERGTHPVSKLAVSRIRALAKRKGLPSPV